MRHCNFFKGKYLVGVEFSHGTGRRDPLTSTPVSTGAGAPSGSIAASCLGDQDLVNSRVVGHVEVFPMCLHGRYLGILEASKSGRQIGCVLEPILLERRLKVFWTRSEIKQRAGAASILVRPTVSVTRA